MRTSFKAAAGLMTAGLFLAACGDAPESGGEQKATSDYPTGVDLNDDFDPNAHFNYAYVAFTSSWDPIKSVNGADIIFYIPVYDRLLQPDDEGNIIPMLAEEFTPAEDGKSMTLKLKEGLSFSDGTPFNAEAAKFNLDRASAQGSAIRGDVYMITGTEVVDEYTVKINVSGSLGALPAALGARPGIMVSPTAAQAGTLETEPVGIGPYRTTAISPGDSADYEKVDGYWDPDAQRVATMTYKFIADDQARYNALRNGEIDAAIINPDQFDDAEGAGLQVVANPAVNFLYVALNTSSEAFSDPEVNKAMNMAINREAIAEGLYDGHCTPSAQPFPATSVGYSEKVGNGLDKYPYDPEAAKAIFEEKGVTNLEIVNGTPNVTIYTKFAEVVQADLAAAGVNVSVKPMPANQMVQEFSFDQSAQMISSVYTGLNDPDALYGRYLSSSALFNPGKYEYTKLTELALAAASPVEDADRTPLYEEYIDEWMENPPHVIPICHIHLGHAFSDKVSNVHQLPSGSPTMRGVAVNGD